MVYTHVARQGVAGVASPLDLLGGLDPAEVQAALEATRQLPGADEVRQRRALSGVP